MLGFPGVNDNDREEDFSLKRKLQEEEERGGKTHAALKMRRGRRLIEVDRAKDVGGEKRARKSEGCERPTR